MASASIHYYIILYEEQSLNFSLLVFRHKALYSVHNNLYSILSPVFFVQVNCVTGRCVLTTVIQRMDTATSRGSASAGRLFTARLPLAVSYTPRSRLPPPVSYTPLDCLCR